MWTPAFLVLVAFCALVSLPHDADSSRILGVFPHIGKSHFFIFEPMMKMLALRGHDVHVISHFPQEKPLSNYTDISVKGSITEFEPIGGITFGMLGDGPSRLTTLMSGLMLGSLGTASCEAVLEHPSVTRLLNSNDTFDLVITEQFNADCILGFAHKFQAPNVAVSSCILMPWAAARFAEPDNPSYIPMSMTKYSDRMNFFERVENTVFTLFIKTLHHFVFTRPQQVIASNVFGKDLPSLDVLARNTSLMLVNSHSSLNRVRPLVPAIVEIGGVHVSEPMRLPEDLDKWISEAPEGVIFFSMGSMLRSDSLPVEKLNAFLQAFSELPQRVLWRFEGNSVSDKPDNVRFGKWMPQRDILGHPNVRVFITHCGLLGTIEAVVSGVPMVAIPIFGDQSTNFKSVEASGVAVGLDYNNITKETVLSALREVLGNSSYRENAKRLSEEYLDRPSSAMDTAIFWIEYVIRHKGAHHLRSAAVDLPWYQYLLLDVALLILSTITAVVVIIYYLVKIMLGFCGRSRSVKTKTH